MTYLVLPPVLLPMPLPPVLGLVGAGGTGVGLVVTPPEVEVSPVALPVVLPVVLPLVVPPAPARWSRRQVSRSVPMRPTHFAGTSVVAPVDAEPLAPTLEPDWPPDWPTFGRSLAPVVLLPPALDPEVPVPALVPALPEAEPDPEDWAIAAEDSARSAAAVAAVRVFNIMMESPRVG